MKRYLSIGLVLISFWVLMGVLIKLSNPELGEFVIFTVIVPLGVISVLVYSIIVSVKISKSQPK